MTRAAFHPELKGFRLLATRKKSCNSADKDLKKHAGTKGKKMVVECKIVPLFTIDLFLVPNRKTMTKALMDYLGEGHILYILFSIKGIG